ncbi:mucin-2-like [Rhopalosiphum padi]|uniref:mucin-2-like n=1 Tax=Rhopalosiphum padi TaxID=40932 RepID=UPI00298E91DD|nr:mucin-2-like [Rhopalosiphum padi]
MAAKKKLFSDRKMKEPERKDNEKISANNSNIVDKRSTATTSLQQAVELLDRCQKLLQAANAEAASHETTEAASHATTEAASHATTEAASHATTEAASHATTEAASHATTEAASHATTEAAAHATTEAAAHTTTEAAAHATTEAAAHATTAARVRRMPTAELRRDPVLWVAYTRGWNDRALVFSKSTNVGPKTAVTDRSQSPRPRPPPMPQTTRLLRPPPQPLMAVLVPRPKSFIPPSPPATRKVDQKSAQRTPAEQTTTAPPQNSWQRRNQSRTREYRRQKKAANPTTSQQYCLEKPAPSTTQPAPGPMSLEATNTPVPEAKTPEVSMPTGQTEATEQLATATSIPVDMMTSPDEEKELQCDMMDVGPPDDVDTVFQITSPDPTTPPRHG